MKLTVRTVLLTMLTLSLSTAVAAHGTVRHELVRLTADLYQGISVVVNGRTLSETGFVYQDRTYLPVRALAEALGAAVSYDDAEKTATVSGNVDVSELDDPVTQVQLSNQLGRIRKATAKYQDIQKAIDDGFKQSSGMIPNHGYHFINVVNALRSIELTRPSGLVYIHDGDSWQLAALEYSALLKPSQPLLPGGQWVQHEAACHYADGNELLESNVFGCPSSHPRTNSELVTWHPSVWTYHVWAFYPNPLGISAATNPLLITYNIPGVDVEHHHHD